MGPEYLGDVTHWKRGLRFGKSQSWVPASEEEGWLSELGEARWLCALRALHVGWVESWRCKSSQHRKIVSLSPHVETFKLKKVNKGFVPEPISWILYFQDFYVYEQLWTFFCIVDPVYVTVVAIEKGVFGTLSTKVSQLTYYIYNRIQHWIAYKGWYAIKHYPTHQPTNHQNKSLTSQLKPIWMNILTHQLYSLFPSFEMLI